MAESDRNKEMHIKNKHPLTPRNVTGKDLSSCRENVKQQEFSHIAEV